MPGHGSTFTIYLPVCGEDPEAEAESVLQALERMATACLRASNLDSLRGHEGAASAAYFECYGSFFPGHAPFERRSRRPPHNAANAILTGQHANTQKNQQNWNTKPR
jgi:CRISPR-associated protein Cas1